MIGQRSTVSVTDLFYAVCGSCGSSGPDARDEGTAKALAVSAGWTARVAFISVGEVTIFTCPFCQKDQ